MKRVLILVIVLALFMAACAPTATEPLEASTTQEPAAAVATPDPKPVQSGPNNSNVKAGTYTASEQGYLGPVTVTVDVAADGSIVSVKADAPEETAVKGGAAIDKLSEMMVKYQTLDLDVISGATLSSDAFITAAETALKAAGCDVAYLKTVPVVLQGEDETLNADVVVVGAGYTGLSAAVTAYQAGAKVVVLESNNVLAARGEFTAIDTRITRELKLPYTVDDVYYHLINVNMYLSDARLTRAILERSSETVEWMEANGIELYSPYPFNKQPWQQETPIKWSMIHRVLVPADTTSDILFQGFLGKISENGGEYRLNTKATQILTDANGTITGVLADKEDGGKLTVNCKAVVVATGGYGGNAEMVADVFGMDTIKYDGNKTADGTGLQMCWDIGAAKWNVKSAMIHNITLVPSKSKENYLRTTKIGPMLKTALLWVDPHGDRFIDEYIGLDATYVGNAIYTIGGKYFTVFDQATVDAYTDASEYPLRVTQSGGIGEWSQYEENTQDGIDRAVAEGVIFKANTLEELAAAAGMDAETFIASVEKYNEAVRDGADKEFGKPKEYLKFAVEKGPFYAADCVVTMLATLGGLRVNEKMEVQTKEVQTIPGLYTGGNNAAGYYGGQGYTSWQGLAAGFAWFSGRIAGENAAAYALGK